MEETKKIKNCKLVNCDCKKSLNKDLDKQETLNLIEIKALVFAMCREFILEMSGSTLNDKGNKTLHNLIDDKIEHAIKKTKKFNFKDELYNGLCKKEEFIKIDLINEQISDLHEESIKLREDIKNNNINSSEGMKKLFTIMGKAVELRSKMNNI